MNTRTLISIALVLVAINSSPSRLRAEAVPEPEESNCTLASSIDTTKGKPLVYGDSFRVPSLRLRFVKKSTGESVVPKAVHIHYLWKWLEYPYPEHGWGAWVDAEELVNCTPSGRATLSVPELIVRPRGWYDGKYIRF